MPLTSFNIDKRNYQLSYDKIRRESDIFIYWGTIHVSKAIEFSCIKIDDNPIFITSPITLPAYVEAAILHAIVRSEQVSEVAVFHEG